MSFKNTAFLSVFELFCEKEKQAAVVSDSTTHVPPMFFYSAPFYSFYRKKQFNVNFYVLLEVVFTATC